jgi:glutamate 5-kinase
MINCYESLISEGIIPIANEDDAVSVTMSMFSDNDELASLVAELINADSLIILSDTEGLYTGNPDDLESEKLTNVQVDENVEKYVQRTDKGEGEGRGGMKSKIKIAKSTAAKNIPTYIANGKRKNVILDIIAGKDVGTKFVA